MLTLNFECFPIIQTERLLLRQVEISDAKEIFILRSDERIIKYLDRPPAKSVEDALIFIEKTRELELSKNGINWAITLKEDPTLIGTICYWNILKEHYRAEIGYSLLPHYQGTGIMQEALSAVLIFGFEKMKLHSIEANVNPENKPSIKLLERNKFRKEAHFKENYYYNGKFLDTVIYSLLSPYK